MRSEPLSQCVLHGSCTCEESTTRTARPMILTDAQQSETVSRSEAVLIRRADRTGMTSVMIRHACTVEEIADLLGVGRLVRECLTDLPGRCGQAAEDGRASQRRLRRGVGVAEPLLTRAGNGDTSCAGVGAFSSMTAQSTS